MTPTPSLFLLLWLQLASQENTSAISPTPLLLHDITAHGLCISAHVDNVTQVNRRNPSSSADNELGIINTDLHVRRLHHVGSTLQQPEHQCSLKAEQC